LLLLIQGIWVPIIPAGIGLVITGSMVLYLQSNLNQPSKKA
jgi:CHASE2 domain-containing sensor protein